MWQLMKMFLNYIPDNWYYYVIALILIDVFIPKIFEVLAIYVEKAYRSHKYLWFSKLVQTIFFIYIYILSYACGIGISYIVVWYYKLNKYINMNIFETSLIITLLISLIFILLYLLPLGELRYIIINTRRLTIDEYTRISKILSKMFINKKIKDLDKIKFRVVNENECNAYTCGRKTVVLTKTILQNLNDDELAGIMAHEFAHLFNKDNVRFSFLQGISFFFRVYFESINVLRDMIRAIIESLEIMIVFLWPISIPLAFLNYINRQINKPIEILIKTFNRHQEYLADDFAVKIGLKENLIKALEKIDDSKFQNIFISLRNTHPTSEFRIEAIKHGYFV